MPSVALAFDLNFILDIKNWHDGKQGRPSALIRIVCGFLDQPARSTKKCRPKPYTNVLSLVQQFIILAITVLTYY